MESANITLVVLAGAIIACVTQAVKIVAMTGTDEEYPPPDKFIAHALSGGLGYYSYAMLLIAVWHEQATPELLLGSAAVIGWIGGTVFLALGRYIQATFKIPLGLPTEKDEKPKD